MGLKRSANTKNWAKVRNKKTRKAEHHKRTKQRKGW